MQNLLTGCSAVLHNPTQPLETAAVTCVCATLAFPFTPLACSWTHEEKHLHTCSPVGQIQQENKRADRLSGVKLLFLQLWCETSVSLELHCTTTGKAADHFNRRRMSSEVIGELRGQWHVGQSSEIKKKQKGMILYVNRDNQYLGKDKWHSR